MSTVSFIPGATSGEDPRGVLAADESGRGVLRAVGRAGGTGPVPRLGDLVVGVADLLLTVAAAVAAVADGLRPSSGAAVAALWLTALYAAADVDRIAEPRAAIGAVVRATCVLGLCCWIVPTLGGVEAAPEQLLALTVALAGGATVIRLTACLVTHHVRRTTGGVRVLVVGDAEIVAGALPDLIRSSQGQWNIVAGRVCGPTACIDDLPVPVAVGTDDLALAAASLRAAVVLVLPGRELGPHELRRICWQLEGGRARVCIGTGMLDVAPERMRLETVGDLDILTVRRSPLRRPALLAKDVAERVIAALLLALLAPLLIAVAVLVRVDSPGPSVFQQCRVGRHGREFTMYKFRTMTCDAEIRRVDLDDLNESVGEVLFKVREDPRITRVGRLLRRYSLDEVPQLLNVVRGQMALVGPRPALPQEVARYDADPRRRLAVKPGLTGLWQVSGRSDLSWEDTVRLDLHYVDNWSVALDASIVLRTARAVLGHRGAY